MQYLTRTQLKLAQQLLDSGAVLAVPTETVYGLAVKYDHPTAIAKLLQLKDRKTQNDTKVLTLMLADRDQIADFAILSPRATQIAKQHFPGELTMVLPKNPGFHNCYFDHFDTIGIRIPNHAYMLKLLRLTGPLLVTSANQRGATPCHNAKAVAQQLPTIDAIVTGRAGGGLPSTVISINNHKLAVLRQGSLVFKP